MKIFLSYHFTGEDFNALKIILDKITSIFESKKIKYFCSLYLEYFFTKNNFTTDQIYNYCNKKLEDCDVLLFFIKSNAYSKGMEIELEHAIKHNKKMILAIQKDLHFPKFRKHAKSVIEYDTLEDLCKKLKKYNF